MVIENIAKFKLIVLIILFFIISYLLFCTYSKADHTILSNLPLHQTADKITKMYNEQNIDPKVLNDIVQKYAQIKWIHVFDKDDQLVYNSNSEIDSTIFDNCNNTEIIGAIYEIQTKNIIFNRICLESSEKSLELCFGLYDDTNSHPHLNMLIIYSVLLTITFFVTLYYYFIVIKNLNFVSIGNHHNRLIKENNELIRSLTQKIKEYENNQITNNLLNNNKLLFPYLLILLSNDLENNDDKVNIKTIRTIQNKPAIGFQKVNDESVESKSGILYLNEGGRNVILKPAKFYDKKKVDHVIGNTEGNNYSKEYVWYLHLNNCDTKRNVNGKEYNDCLCCRAHIPGNNLRDFYKENIVSLKEQEKRIKILEIIKEICTALIKLKQDCKIAHNNLKMNNIIFNKGSQQFVLVDFIPITDDWCSHFNGNQEYKNIDNRRKNSESKEKNDEQTELFKFGLLLYEFFSGEILIEQRRNINNNKSYLSDIQSKIIEQKIEKLQIDKDVKKILNNCLLKKFNGYDNFYSNFYTINHLNFLMCYTIIESANFDIFQIVNKKNRFLSSCSKADIFSLGVIMFELLTSQKPFIPDVISEILKPSLIKPSTKSMYLHFKLKTYLDKMICKTNNDKEKEMVDIVFKCLSNEYSSIDAIKNDIETILERIKRDEDRYLIR